MRLPNPLVVAHSSQTTVARQADARAATGEFCNRSVSPETRRAYRRVVREFASFTDDRRPSEITPADVLRWRDRLIENERSAAATVAFKLAVVRSFFDYLQLIGLVKSNPALSKLVPPPAIPEDLRGRALATKEVRYLLSGPDRAKAEGARDYALLLLMLKTSLRVSEACGLRLAQIKSTGGRWVVRVKVKGGRERAQPIPADVKHAIDEYLKLDRTRRQLQRTDAASNSASHTAGGREADEFVFQPSVNFRTLEFNKSLSPSMAWRIVRKWGEFSGVGKVSPHDLRRTAITRALDQGLSYRQVQMMSGHKDPKTVMRYDHARENLEQNAANFLDYESDEV